MRPVARELELIDRLLIDRLLIDRLGGECGI
jgi:hypothetical protein